MNYILGVYTNIKASFLVDTVVIKHDNQTFRISGVKACFFNQYGFR